MRVTRKTTCSKCQGPLEENRKNKQRYCLACHNEHARGNRKDSYKELTPEKKLKVRCRRILMMAINRGEIIRQPCEKCGEPKAQAHHTDYTKPRLVIWLCEDHHREQHRIDEANGIKPLTGETIEKKKRAKLKYGVCSKCSGSIEPHRLKYRYCRSCASAYMRERRANQKKEVDETMSGSVICNQ